MPRPRKVGEFAIVTAAVPKSTYMALRQIHARRSQREKVSLSDLIREAIDMYVKEQAVSLGLSGVFEIEEAPASRAAPNHYSGPGDAGTDPIILFRKKQFERQIEVFERSWQKVADAWELLKPRIAGGYNTRVLNSDFFRLRDQVREHEKWLNRILRDYRQDIRDQALDSRLRDLVTRVINISGELQKMLG